MSPPRSSPATASIPLSSSQRWRAFWVCVSVAAFTILDLSKVNVGLPAIEASELSNRGSLFFTRPTLFSYMGKREWLDTMAAELFDVLASGKVKTNVRQRYALADVATAHRDLEARKTTGSTILIP